MACCAVGPLSRALTHGRSPGTRTLGDARMARKPFIRSTLWPARPRKCGGVLCRRQSAPGGNPQRREA